MSLFFQAFTIIFTVGSSVEMFYQHSSEDNLNLIMGIIMGIFNLFTGVVLVTAIVKVSVSLEIVPSRF